jgi:hypothetical protein
MMRNHWQKSTFSGLTDCVEVCWVGETVYVRDSKDRSGPVLSFSCAEWSAFTTGAKAGQFDTNR